MTLREELRVAKAPIGVLVVCLGGVQSDSMTGTAARYTPGSRAEAKTHRDAIGCLKRHPARPIWHLLQPPTLDEGSRSPSTS
jgi:hypothetical protein